jgi:4-carboxymuconolactone decarboxylase
MEEAQYEKGVQQFTQMVGTESIDSLREQFKSLSPDFERYVMGFIGGEIWSRPNLDLRTRSLCSIAILAALGRTNALELNIKMALNNGATKTEIIEVFFQVAIYAGFAAAWDGLVKADKVFREIDGG